MVSSHHEKIPAAYIDVWCDRDLRTPPGRHLIPNTPSLGRKPLAHTHDTVPPKKPPSATCTDATPSNYHDIHTKYHVRMAHLNDERLWVRKRHKPPLRSRHASDHSPTRCVRRTHP